MRRNRDLHKGVSEFKETLKETSKAQSSITALEKKLEDVSAKVDGTLKLREMQNDGYQELFDAKCSRLETQLNNVDFKLVEKVEDMLNRKYEEMRNELEEVREYLDIELESRDRVCKKRSDEAEAKRDVELDEFEDFVKDSMEKVVVELKDEIQPPALDNSIIVADMQQQVTELRDMFMELKASSKGRCYREAGDITDENEHALGRRGRSFSASRIKNVEHLGKKV